MSVLGRSEHKTTATNTSIGPSTLQTECVRSLIISRSNWLNDASMCIISRPQAPEVSSVSVKLLNEAPALSTFSKMRSRSPSLRLSPSSFQTTRTSPPTQLLQTVLLPWLVPSQGLRSTEWHGSTFSGYQSFGFLNRRATLPLESPNTVAACHEPPCSHAQNSPVNPYA
jgi:hypothetical protein